MPAWLRSRVWLVALLGVIEVAYVFYFTAGKFADPPVRNYYYDLLAEGFRRGHLYLSQLPDPRLLAQANPYDHRFRPLWLVDTSLYHGKYYLYWGPIPALLQALAKSVLRVDRLIGDQYLTLFFLSGSAILGALLIERIAARLFERMPRWLIALAIATFALANPVVYLISTSGVYQAAITGGQMFVLAGLLFAFDAVWERATEGRARRQLVLAGAAFALAIGCRNSLGFCIALLIAATALATSWRSATPLRNCITHAACLGVPVALGVFAMLAYNKLRFDAWLEFGTRWQLTTVPLRVSSDYISANLYTYALAPFGVSCRFPYALQSWQTGPKGLPAWLPSPDGYLTAEPVSGFLRAAPITWLFPLALAVAVRQAMFLRRHAQPDPRALAYVWCAACLALLGATGGLVIFGFYFATMRYLADFSFGVVALGLLGGFSWFARATSGQPRIAASVFTLLAASTIALGLLLGYQGYDNQFKLFNPAIDARITQALSLCPKPTGTTASP
jgi:hypothetical protein